MARTRLLALAAAALVLGACETTTEDRNHMNARINEARAAVGARALVPHEHINSTADGWARRMRDDWVAAGCGAYRPHLRHSNLGAQHSPQHVTGSWKTLGENVGAASAGRGGNDAVDRLHTAYMNSPTHRANVTDGRYRWSGQGIVYGPTVDQKNQGHCPGVAANSHVWSTQVYVG